MMNAWKIYRKGGYSFSESLKRAWLTAKASDENARRIEEKKAAKGITEETRTWYGWKEIGREVIHESQAIFSVVIVDGSTKSKTRMLSFFGESQTQVAV